jgi:putative heme-binding domain-containing protein
LDLPDNRLAGIITPIFSKGTTGEQQEMLITLSALPLEKGMAPLKKLIAEAAANRIAPEVILDLIEAVEVTQSEALLADLDALKSMGYSTDAYKETLYGGRWWQGREVFNANAAAQCVRCHAVDGAGGQVGPALDDIATKLSREEILESLIEPSARIAPGYGSVTLTLKDGETVNGLLLEEDDNRVVLKSIEAEPLNIPKARIANRTNQPSAMPPMGRIISKRELRDLIEYLSSLKGK